MTTKSLTSLSVALLLASATATELPARGFGGFHGGGGMGGFSGGAHAGGGGFSGAGGFGGYGGGNLAGARGDYGFAGSAGALGDRGFAGNAGAIGDRGFAGNVGAIGDRGFAGNAGAIGDRGFAGNAGAIGDRGIYGGATSGQLSSFLGLPSDEGFHGLSNEFNVNRGAVEGPRGGVAAGATVEGPRGNEAARGVAVGPNGNVAGGAAVRGANGYGGGRGFVAGPNGVAAGFGRITPTDRYFTGRCVQGNFHDWGIYGHGWYAAHPGAWYAAGWAAGTAWTAATWPAIDAWFDYPETVTPVNYNYGDNITSDSGNVYVDGQSAGTTEDYYNQSTSLADAGAQAAAPPDEQWLALGVFALVQHDHQKSDLTIQLAVDKQGVIRGNYTDSHTNNTMPVQGSVDKSTQRVAFTVGDKKDVVFETGLLNLTRDESPVLIQHKDHSEQWILVRLQPPADGGQATGGDVQAPAQ